MLLFRLPAERTDLSCSIIVLYLPGLVIAPAEHGSVKPVRHDSNGSGMGHDYGCQICRLPLE